jgi:hypothetical protein
MKTTTLLLMTVLIAISCRKNKDSTPAVYHVYHEIYTYEKDKDNANMKMWSLLQKPDALSLTAINADKSLEAKVLFAYYKDEKGNGLYGPALYPVTYGQQNWKTQNNITFKKPAFTAKGFADLSSDDPDIATAAFIEKSWEKGTLIGNKITGIKTQDVFLFEIAGKCKGIVVIGTFFSKETRVIVEIWTK